MTWFMCFIQIFVFVQLTKQSGLLFDALGRKSIHPQQRENKLFLQVMEGGWGPGNEAMWCHSMHVDIVCLGYNLFGTLFCRKNVHTRIVQEVCYTSHNYNILAANKGHLSIAISSYYSWLTSDTAWDFFIYYDLFPKKARLGTDTYVALIWN